jgi:NAD(P)-dependent dehydrogenase (short-subunit alcohol dehydrogenase family)
MVDLVKQIYTDIGPVGGIVCNAGTAVSKPALEMTREDFDTQFEVNVWGVFNACQACAA